MDADTELRESIWELKDIMRDISRLLEDSELISAEKNLVTSAYEKLKDALYSLEVRA